MNILQEAIRFLYRAWEDAEGEGQPLNYVDGHAGNVHIFDYGPDADPDDDEGTVYEWRPDIRDAIMGALADPPKPVYVAVGSNCQDCGREVFLLGLFTTEEAAKKAAAAWWGGTCGKTEVFPYDDTAAGVPTT